MGTLRVVPLQLSFWRMGDVVLPVQVPQDIERERAARSGRQWLQSAREYCLWRAGDGWRRLGTRESRNSAERWYYLEGARTITDILYSQDKPASGLQLALPVLNPAPTPDASELKYRTMKRADLVAALLRIDPTLTDAHILSHLPRPKLAHMLREREKMQRHATQTRRTA